MKTYKTIIAMVAAGLACSAVTSQATMATLTPGTGVPAASVAGTSVAGTGSGGGTLFDSMSAQNFSYNGNTGSIATSVYTSDANNPLGGLTFVYTLIVTGGDISSVALNGFGPASMVAVGYGLSSSGIISAESFTTSGVVNFSFQNAITPAIGGAQYLVVGTSLNKDAANGAGFLDGGTFPTLTPILAPVPEPSTVVAGALMLLPFGIGAIRSLRKDRTA